MAGPEVTNLTWYVLTILVAGAGGIIKHLLNRNAKLEQIVDDHNQVLIKNNEALANAYAALAATLKDQAAEQARERDRGS